jgi:hypothetical protein
MKAWKKEALHLWLTTSLTKSEIARKIDKPRTTVRDYLFRAQKEDYVEEVYRKSNVLVFDIETSPMIAYVWGLWKQNIPIDRIIRDWSVICWSAKWLGEKEVKSTWVDTRFGGMHELDVVQGMWELLDEADVVVAHNAKRFDVPKMNAKFIEYGLKEPSPYKVVDTLAIAKSRFKFTSNKLDYITQLLEHEGKHETNFQLWVDCMKGDSEALKRMVDYCEQDVLELEKTYLKLRHWDKQHPNLAVFDDKDTLRCGTCLSEDLEPLEGKRAVTSTSSYPVYRCKSCGKIQRDSSSTTTTTKRKNLLRNIQ